MSRYRLVAGCSLLTLLFVTSWIWRHASSEPPPDSEKWWSVCLNLPPDRDLSTPVRILSWLKESRLGPHKPVTARPLRADQAKKKVRELLTRGFVLRNNPAIDLTRPIPWGDNPRRDDNWHVVLNRLEFLEPFLTAFEASGEDSLYETPKAVLLDWIRFNLDEDRRNRMKWNDMSTGFRAVFLANAIDHEIRSEGTDARRLLAMIRAAKAHLDVLSDPRIFPMNNHGFFLLMGLKSLATRVPELAGARAASDYANERLRTLLKAQYSAEGIHQEYSPSYHLFVTQALGDLDRMGIFDDEPLLGQVHQTALNHNHEMYHPNGDVVQIGDSGPTPVRDVPPAARYLLSNGLSGAPPSDTNGYYHEVGYAIFRSSWRERPPAGHSFLFLNAGLHGEHIHAHSDFLAFEWSELGMPVLVDSGKFEYRRWSWRDLFQDSWREFFESTRAGNAVEVDGRSDNLNRQARFGSALAGWGAIDPKTRFVEASLDRNTVGVRQTRLLLFKEKNWLLVIDRLRSPKRRAYRQWFHFHERIDVRKNGAGFTAMLPDARGAVHVQDLLEKEPGELELVKGREGDSPQGWISRAYLQRTPRHSAAFKRSGKDTIFITIFSLRSPVTAPEVSASESSVSIAFTDAAGRRESFEYRPGTEGAAKVRSRG